MAIVSTCIKVVVSLLVVAALLATRFISPNNADADPKINKMTHRHLKGPRKLQGSVSGFATGSGSAGGSGSTTNGDVLGTTGSNGSGDFSVSSGSSGFVNTSYGGAQGSAAAGATGSQTGSVNAATGIGSLSFGGTTNANGAGSFGAGFSPVGFKAVTTTIPGTPTTSGGSKKKSTNLSLPTTVTNFVPFSTGRTGGFGAGTGGVSINSGSTGTLAPGVGTGSSTGGATSFGGGSASASNLFGSAGGSGFGSTTGGATGGGTTTLDVVGGTFIDLGTSNTNFNNLGSGFFGRGGFAPLP